MYKTPFKVYCTPKVRHEKSVVRQILLVRNHRQDFLHAKKRNPGYD